MMKRILLTVAVLLPAIILGQQSDLERFNIKGAPFKQFSVTHKGNLPQIPTVYSVKEGVYDDRAYLKSGFYYDFDENGNIYNISAVDGGKSVKITYQGKNEISRTIAPDKVVVNFLYDSKGFLVGKKMVNAFTGETTESSVYTLDAKGNIISEVFMDADEEQAINHFSYDAKGNLIKVSLEDIVEGGEMVYTYKYDTKGNLIEYKSGADKVLFKYDQKGNVIAVSGQYFDELLNLTYKYVFDTHGNWTAQHIYEDGKKVATVQRSIWYMD